MERKVFINKVAISPEAVFDYEDMFFMGEIPRKDIKNQVEEHLANLSCEGVLHPYTRHLRVKYFDEETDTMLMLFFYKGQTFGCMQIWNLAGICRADFWNQDMDDDGQIRNWLKTVIKNIPKEEDWVVRLRKWQDEGRVYTETYSVTGLPKEVTDAKKYR